MQNSGIGNAINPLTSLVDKEIYSIPVLLLIGWRGEPGTKDAIQHKKDGVITLKLFETLGIPYSILPDTLEETEKTLDKAFEYMNREKAPFALVVKKGTFEKYNSKKENNEHSFSREDAIKSVTSALKPEDVIVSTTGKISRELYEFREKNQQSHERDFLVVGSMGHASQIALGISLNQEKQVYCFDGDGAYIMHMGELGVIASKNPKYFKHIVFNNAAHDSVGGQPTVGDFINIPMIAKACGYKEAFSANNEEELKDLIKKTYEMEGPILIEVKVKKGARSDLGRPTMTTYENKEHFMRSLSKCKQ
jgi:phosphonopyruvate decarboxylase